jgi:hypothetical protein
VSEWADDDWHTVSLCWWDGSSDTAEDGRVIGKLDGDTIFDVSNVAVWVNGDTWVRAAFGHEGLAGIVDNVKAWDDLSQCGVTEVVDSSVPCCTTCACTTTPGTIPAGATGPILPTITPLWTPACVGGGTVLTVSDLAHSESWAD